MINKISNYILIAFFLLFLFILISLTFNADLRRSTFHKAIAIFNFYQIQSIMKHVQVRDFSSASDKLLKYIEFSKKISEGKSSILYKVYEAVEFVASKATTQKEFNLLENVFFELIKLDPNLYNVRVWLARAISDTDYENAIMHLEKAIEISPASEKAYREIIRISQNNNDTNLAQKFCDKYKKAQLGGSKQLHVGNYFDSSNIRKMAVEFFPETKSQLFYSHAGIKLNSFENYEFVPTAPIDISGINFYFSLLPGIRIYIKEMSVYTPENILKIPIKDFTATSRSAYIENNSSENLSFLLVNAEDEVLRLRYNNILKSVEKIIIKMNFVRMDFVNNLLCKTN